MQQKDEMNQQLPSSIVQKRSLRERIGIYMQAGNAVDAITKLREAEDAGVQQAWMAMGGAGFADVLTVLAAAASQTKHIKLGTSIVPAYPRHPLVMAQQALAIHDLAPGRLRLGVGSGNQSFLEARYGPSPTRPLRYLKEYVEVLRDILWQGNTHHQGEFFQIVETLPRIAQVPLLIPALGLKAFRLAGEISDGALASLSPVPYLLNQTLPALRAGAEASNRSAPPIVACLPVAVSTDEAAVLAAVCQMIQYLAQTGAHAHMFAQAGWPSIADGDEEELNSLARSLVISGNEATVQTRVREILASGLDELILLGMPIANEAMERKQLLHLIGSL